MNWVAIEAVGTWVAGVGSILVSVLIITQNRKINTQQRKLQEEISAQQTIITKKIADRDFEIKRREYDATLFDKRYKVYECFMRCFDNFESFLDNPYFAYDDNPYWFATRVFGGTYPYDTYYVKSPDTFAGDDSYKSQVFEWDLSHKIKNELVLSEFCYPKEISDSILEYNKYCFEILLDYRLHPKSTNDMDKRERAKREKLDQNLTDLIKCHKQTKENDIVGKMKKLLNLQF
jgi:hypothetical protein